MTFRAKTVQDAIDPNNPYPVQVQFDMDAWEEVVEFCEEEMEVISKNRHEFTVEYANSENFLNALPRIEDYDYQIV